MVVLVRSVRPLYLGFLLSRVHARLTLALFSISLARPLSLAIRRTSDSTRLMQRPFRAVKHHQQEKQATMMRKRGKGPEGVETNDRRVDLRLRRVAGARSF